MEPRNDFLKLPNEIQVEIGKSCASILISLPKTSRHFASLFAREHRQIISVLRLLLGHAALGEWDAARKIWRLLPELLTYRGTVYHPNPSEITIDMNPGRYKYVNRTAWQIALMNEEYEIAEKWVNT